MVQAERMQSKNVSREKEWVRLLLLMDERKDEDEDDLITEGSNEEEEQQRASPLGYRSVHDDDRETRRFRQAIIVITITSMPSHSITQPRSQ